MTVIGGMLKINHQDDDDDKAADYSKAKQSKRVTPNYEKTEPQTHKSYMMTSDVSLHGSFKLAESSKLASHFS